jgi:hypothetical protein
MRNVIGAQLLPARQGQESLSLLLTGQPYYHEVVGRQHCHGWGEGADVGVGRKAARKRAVGTREHIIAYLTEINELYDANGMASTQLAAAVGYPGSSVAFAQLLSGMERSGLIEREVRGKRTYRITLGPAPAAVSGLSGRIPGVAVAAGAGRAGVPAGTGEAAGTDGVGGVGGEGGFGTGPADFDYDELARRLLIQVVRRLAAAEPEASLPDRPDRPAPPDQAALQETVTGLEYELATAWTKHGKLAEENVRLREQLRAAQRSLALAAERVRRLPGRTGLDSSEVVLLQRLLTSDGQDGPAGQDGPDRPDDPGVPEGSSSVEEAPSVLG